MRTFMYVLAGFVLGIVYMCGVLAVLERRTAKRLAREFSERSTKVPACQQ